MKQILYVVTAILFSINFSAFAKEEAGSETNETGGGSSEYQEERIAEWDSSTNQTTSVIYPLQGCDGKTVRATLHDLINLEPRVIGPFESPKELVVCDLKQDRQYWVNIEEYNPNTKNWDLIVQHTIAGDVRRYEKHQLTSLNTIDDDFYGTWNIVIPENTPNEISDQVKWISVSLTTNRPAPGAGALRASWTWERAGKQESIKGGYFMAYTESVGWELQLSQNNPDSDPGTVIFKQIKIDKDNDALVISGSVRAPRPKFHGGGGLYGNVVQATGAVVTISEDGGSPVPAEIAVNLLCSSYSFADKSRRIDDTNYWNEWTKLKDLEVVTVTLDGNEMPLMRKESQDGRILSKDYGPIPVYFGLGEAGLKDPSKIINCILVFSQEQLQTYRLKSREQ